MDPVYQMLIAVREALATENREQPSREGAIIYTKVEEAILWRQHQKFMNNPQVLATPSGGS